MADSTVTKRIGLKAVSLGAKKVETTREIGRSKQKHIAWGQAFGGSNLVEPPVDPQDLADLMIDSTDFATCVIQIARDVVGDWHLEETEFGKSVEARQVEDDRKKIEEFLRDAPGGERSDESLRDTLMKMMIDYGCTGNGYLEIATEQVDGKDVPAGIYHLQSTRTRVRKDKLGFAQIGADPTKIAWFRAYGTDPFTGIGGEIDDAGDFETEPWARDIPIDDAGNREPLNVVKHFIEYHPSSFWYGVSRFVPAIGAIRGNTFASDRNIKFFLNKALPEIALILEHKTETVDSGEMEEFLQAIADHFMTEMQGEHFIPLFLELPNGMELTVEKLSPEIKDADHRLYRLDNRDEILRAASVMPNRVGIIESGNLGGGTGESQIEIYKKSVIEPPREMLERFITRLLEDLGVRTLAFVFDAFDATDEAREATIASVLAAAAWMTINEGRAWATANLRGFDLPEIDEPWADLPFPVLAPQLSLLDFGIDGVNPAGGDGEDEVPHAGAQGGPATRAQLVRVAGNLSNPAIEGVREIYERHFGRAANRYAGRDRISRPDGEASQGQG